MIMKIEILLIVQPLVSRMYSMSPFYDFLLFVYFFFSTQLFQL